METRGVFKMVKIGFLWISVSLIVSGCSSDRVIDPGVDGIGLGENKEAAVRLKRIADQYRK